MQQQGCYLSMHLACRVCPLQAAKHRWQTYVHGVLTLGSSIIIAAVLQLRHLVVCCYDVFN